MNCGLYKIGTKHSAHTLQKMKGRASSFRNIQKAYLANRGRIYSLEHKKNISLSLKLKNMKRSDEVKEKIKKSVINAINNGNGVGFKLRGKDEEIKQLYLSNNYTQKQLSMMYNVTSTSIYKLLQRTGVK
jgi:hypothetical protein